MRKRISRTLSIILTAGMIMTSLPSPVWAETLDDHGAGDDIIVNADVDLPEESVSVIEDTVLQDTVQDAEDVVDADETNITDAADTGILVTETPGITDDSEPKLTDEIIIDSIDDVQRDNDSGSEQKELNADYYVSGGDYTYKGDMSETDGHKYKNIFSGIYNDVQVERRGGRFYTGEEIVSLSGKDGTGVSLNKITGGAIGGKVEASEIANSGKKVNFEVHDIPAEFVQDKTVTWMDDNYVEHTTELNDDTLIRKLYAWEYKKDAATGIYHRLSSQEIESGDYFLYDPEDLGNGKTASTVSGNVVVNTAKLKAGKITEDNAIAIVAYMYDASVNDSLFEGMWSYSDDRIFYTLEQLESESDRYSDVTEDYYHDKTPYYDTDIYRKDEMGTFSIAAYAAYRRDDKTNTLTLYDTASQPNYGFMNGFTYGWRSKDIADYLLGEWKIPATWTDPLTKTTYNVALGESASFIDAASGEKRYLGGRRYPILASGVTISYGVAFPDDCTQLLTTGHSKMEMMCVKSIKIEAGPQGQKVGSNITKMNSMFYGNTFGNMGHNVPVTQLSSLDVSALDTSNVTDMSCMFCAQWVTDSGPDVSGFDTSKVTDFSYMFYDAHISNPDVSNFNTSNAVDMSYMFGAEGVWTDFRVKPHAYAQGVYTALDLSSFDFANVDSMAGMFINQRLLSSIKFPSNMDTSHVRDMSELFMSCSSLTLEGAENLTLLDTSSVVDMFGMFGRFHWRNWGMGDKRVLADEYTDRYLSHSDGQECDNRGPAIKELNLAAFANFDTSKVQNMALMFDLPEAATVSFGNNFDTSKVTDMNRMFNLPKVKSLDVSCFNTGSLTKATLMFDLDTCASLNLGNGFNLSNVNINGADYMFTAPVLPELDLTHVNFGSNANALCASSIAYFNLGYLESGCKELETLILPADMPVFADPAALPETMYDEGGDEYDAVYGGNSEGLTLTRSSAPLKNVYGFYNDKEGSDKLISETTIYSNDQSDGNNMVYLKLRMDPLTPAPAPSVEYTVVGYRDGEEVPGDYVVTTFEHNDGIEVYAYSGTLKYDSYAIITANVRRSDGEVFTTSCKVRVEKSESEELRLTDSDGNSFTCYVNKDGNNTVTIKELWDKGSDNSKKTLSIGRLTDKGKTYTVTRIGNNAFRYTRSSKFFNNYGTNSYFTAVALDESVKAIGSYAFDPNDTSQSSVLTFSGPGVEEIGDHAFNDMVAMTTVSLPKVKRLGCGVFSNTTSIKNLTLNSNIESWNNGLLTEEFAKDSELTEFTIPSCISELGPEGLPRSITSVEVPSTVKKIGYAAFSWCSALESITIPATVTEIGEGAFSHCDALSSVAFAAGGQLTKIGDNAFSECKELAEISFPDTVTSFGKEVLKMNSYYGTKLAKAKLPKNIREVPDGTFYDCVSLNEVTLPEDIRRIGAEAFARTTALTSFTIPDSVTVLGDKVFSESGLTSIEFPESITKIPAAACFSCENLESVTFKGKVTEIGAYENSGPDKGYPAGSSFYNCLSLNSITLPDTLTYLGRDSFSGCESLIGDIKIPVGITEIEYGTFLGTAITGVGFPDSVTSIGERAFYACESLENVSFSVNTQSIGTEAFMDCKNLEIIALPVGVKDIGWYAFSKVGYAKNHAELYLPNTVESVGYLAFDNLGGGYGNRAFILYGGSVDDEKKIRFTQPETSLSFDFRYDCVSYNTGWNVTDKGTIYVPHEIKNEGDYSVVRKEALSGNIITKVQDYGDDYYGFDTPGYRYEDTSAVIGGKLYSFDEYGRAAEVTGYEAGKTGVVGDKGILVYLKGGVVQKAVSSELFADNVVEVDGEKYLLQTSGILGTGYYPDSSEYEDGAAEAGITGWYFDDDTAKLLWVKKTDAQGNDIYYGKDYTTPLSGSYPNEDGETVKYADGRSTFLTGLKITDETGNEITRTPLYKGPDAGTAGKPDKATLKLVTLPEGVILDPQPSVKWSIINNNPKIKGNTVITEVSHTDGQIVIKAGAPGRAKVRVTVSASVEGGAKVTYTKDCLVIVEDTNKYPTSVTVTGSTQKIKVGGTLQLTATVLPEDATAGTKVTWASSNPGVASVDNAGLVTGIADGSSVISATTENGVRGTYNIAVGSAPVPVPEPVPDNEDAEEIVLNKGSISLYTGESFKLSATVNPAGAKDKTVTWTTSNPAVAVVNDGKVTAVAAGVDGSGNPAAATAKITATANGAKAGETVKAECTVTVLPKEIVDTDEHGNIIDPSAPNSGVTTYDENNGEANIWVAGLEKEYCYTGNATKPAIHVYKGYKLLTAGTDYTIKYKNNTKVGKHSVTAKGKHTGPHMIIKMKGAYSGSETVGFNINPMPLTGLMAGDGSRVSDNVIFNAAYKAKKKNQLKPTLMYDGARVKYGKKDVTFKWYTTDDEGMATETESTCIEPGTYAVKIFAGTSGNISDPGNSGKQIATIRVEGKPLMSSVKISGFKSKLAYKNGGSVEQPATVKLTHKDKSGTRTLSECNASNPDGDYTVTYTNNHEPGTATVIYEAVKDEHDEYTGAFQGRIVKTFKITGKSVLIEAKGETLNVGECKITLGTDTDDDKYAFTNANIKPSVTVTAKIINNEGAEEEIILRPGKDYSLKYKNNKAVAANNATKKNKDVAPQVIVKGKGNYVLGTTGNAGIVKRFTIVPADLNDLILTISDRTYSKKANDYKKTKILLTDKDYKDLKLKAGAGKDYTVTYETSDGSSAPIAGQVVTVTIKGNNNDSGTGTGSCKGEVKGSYRIIDKKKHKDINKAKAVVNPNSRGKSSDCIYTGSGIEPGQAGQPELKITYGSGKNLKTLTEKTAANPEGDYEILGYFNNVNKGNSAVVLIRGTGDTFRGVRAVKFKIAARGVGSRWGGVYGQGE